MCKWSVPIGFQCYPFADMVYPLRQLRSDDASKCAGKAEVLVHCHIGIDGDLLRQKADPPPIVVGL